MVPGETMPAMFWNAAARARRPASGCGRRSSASGAAGPGRRPPTRCARSRGGLMALGFAPGECASILVQHRRRMGAVPTSPCSVCGGVSNGIYPTDAASQVALPLRRLAHHASLFVEDDEQLDKALEVRARLPLLRKIVVFDMEGLRDLDDPRRHQPRCAARAGPRLPRRPIRSELDAARRRLPARRPGDPGLHLGHHRQAQGRDAQPPRARLHRCAATTR